jgi:hypothetical protein
MEMDVRSDGHSTVITLRRLLWQVEYHITTEAGGANHTDVRIDISTKGFLGFAVRRVALFQSATCLCTHLSTRARWLPQAPDTNFAASADEDLRAIASLVEHELLIFDSGSARCIVDTARRRFLRVDATEDVERLVGFALWQPYTDVARDGDDVVIVPVGSAARLRIRPLSALTPSDGGIR